MTRSIKMPAKINLFLDISGKRPDGYHEIKTVMQSVDLCDTITVRFEGAGNGITVTCSDPALPRDEGNIAHKAAMAFFGALGQRESLRIHIEKNIPSAAGLAGGSADAAGVLLLLNEFFEKAFSEARLRKIGAAVGADVPFCLAGGTAAAEGKGDLVTALPPLPDCFFTLAKPALSVPTAKAYRDFDALPPFTHPDFERYLNALKAGDIGAIGSGMFNAFERVTRAPVIDGIKNIMAGFAPAGCVMSGSGPTVFGLFGDEAAATAAAWALAGTAESVHVCRPAFASGRGILKSF